MHLCTVTTTLNKYCILDDLPTGGTDIDIQLLEAAKSGDLELVKVRTHCTVNGRL